MKKSEVRKIIREEIKKLNEDNGHHTKIGKNWYVDSSFVNLCQKIIPGSTLKHMGFGEFYLETPEGDVQFDKGRGKDFKGKVGRSHQIYDNKNGKIVDKLIKGMEKENKSELIGEAIVLNSGDKNYWPFEEGKTEIWYAKPKYFRNLVSGYDWCKDINCLPNKKGLNKTHVLLGTLNDTSLQKIFRNMQWDKWSPKGEARNKIKDLGLQHTSMSTGDIIKYGNRAWIVDIVGFKEL